VRLRKGHKLPSSKMPARIGKAKKKAPAVQQGVRHPIEDYSKLMEPTLLCLRRKRPFELRCERLGFAKGLNKQTVSLKQLRFWKRQYYRPR